MRLVWKLLRKHISVFELLVFFIANLVGMTVILSGVQIYSDLKPMLMGDEALIGNDYMIITRPVERVGAQTPTFTEEEVEALANEEFVENIGLFSSSQYEVYGSIVFNDRPLSTMMFFESVPDEFIDVESQEWQFERGNDFIPIIIPRNYLNLYNFGFSQTQNLPQITEEMIKRVELGIRLSGNGRTDHYTARIVGFSDRLNTILVPMDFMEWANRYYAPRSQSNGSTRLIIEVQNPGDPVIMEYLDEHGYIAEDKPSESSKALTLLKVCVLIIVAIGLIFSVLSIIILTLSIYLLLQKNITKLETLTLIGYTPASVARPYNIMSGALNISILVISLLMVTFGQRLYIGHISSLAGFEIEASPSAAAIVGAVLTFAIILLNIFIIRRKIAIISRRRS